MDLMTKSGQTCSVPDLIVVPNSGVNRQVPDLNAVYAASVWRVPVADLNSFDDGIGILPRFKWLFKKPSRIAISTRTFSSCEAARLKGKFAIRFPGTAIGSLSGPLDILCCYKYEAEDLDFHCAAEFGDGLAFPDFTLLSSSWKLRASWFFGRRPYTVMSSLGCPFGCVYCMARARKWRPRSAGNCVAELREAKLRFGIRSFQLVDDCFNFDNDRVLEFCELVRPLKLRWFCNNGLRADRMSPEQAKALASAGCKHVSFGIESSDPELLASVNKGETIEQIERAIACCKDAGVPVSGFFLIGLPGSSYEKDLNSLKWAKKHGIGAHFSYFVPSSHWSDGGRQFWGEAASPLSDAYASEAQREIYEMAWRS